MCDLETESQDCGGDRLAWLCHQLKAPLAAIAAVGDLVVAESVNPESLRELASQLWLQVDAVHRVIDAALVEQGRPDDAPYLQELELAPTLDLVLRLAAPLLGDRQASVVVEQELPPIRADPNKLTQILMNLLVNAINYSPPGSGIGVTAQALGDLVAIEVWDQGKGIPVDEQSRVFERFYRGRAERDGSRAGSGLGLYLARKWAEEMGGRLTARSTEGSGSSFTVWLPRLGLRG